MLTVLRDNGEKWLICGGRRFADAIMFDDAMGDLMRQFGHPSCIIHGGAAVGLRHDIIKRLSGQISELDIK